MTRNPAAAAEGMAEARRRIAEAKRTGAEKLDLKALFLTEIPEELLELNQLTSLDLWSNRIGDDGARALATLTGLTSLDLSWNNIGADGARALGTLTALTTLGLWDNNIGADGARALGTLTALTSLDLGRNSIGDDGARALGTLTGLTSLDLRGNPVTDLSPLLNLTKLETLDCSGCQLDDPVPELWGMPSLRHVNLHEANLSGVPAEVLSQSYRDNCLDRLRAHFADLEEGGSAVADVKLMILGNGRVGKTQICRRLRGEAYDDTEPSTHGIRVTSAPLELTPGDIATLKIWDFGGQDIYHGTHALFLKTRAIFPLVWTPGSEETQFHDHGGFTFRNQPLGYWLAYVRQFGGANSPVLVIQTQCDEPEQERLRPPLPDDALDAFPFKKVLHYSARENRGRPALDEALAEAVRWLRRRQGVAVIGKGRAKVKARLEEMYAAGKRLVTQAEFRTLCRKAKNVSSPELLLDYLHNSGAVFYRKGLFGDRIILDQAWALDAVYAVFDRDSKVFRNIERYRGRFRRSDLAEWVWGKHSVDEQELFLSFMEQCGICFTIREGEGGGGVEAEYIAPDLLPERNDLELALQLRQKWDDAYDAEATLEYDLLPPGLMRSLIAKIGAEAGLAAEYWRDGFYFYDAATSSRALVEQRRTDGWAGEIRVRTQRGQAAALLDRVLKFIDERHDAIGARACGRSVTARDKPKGGERVPALKPAHEPAPRPEWYVSYAWNDGANTTRETDVDRLCAEATARGIEIIRDKTAMRHGDRISEFMDRIGRAGRDGRVFIFLSDKYLRSAYCMHELFDVWRNCREDADAFIARTRVFVMPCARIKTENDRAQYAIHWREEFEKTRALVQKHGQLVLSDDGNAEYRLMTRFANETANILKLVQDVLKPRNFDDFVTHGFDDQPLLDGMPRDVV